MDEAEIRLNRTSQLQRIGELKAIKQTELNKAELNKLTQLGDLTCTDCFPRSASRGALDFAM